jgi:hypothetical protein
MNKMAPFRDGAAGREARARQREALIVVSSAKLLRPEQGAELTTPSAALRWLRDFLLMPQPPLLFKEGNMYPLQFVHTFYDRQSPYL